MSTTVDCVLARELADEATSLHLLGQHDASLQTLQRLEGQLPGDCSVQLNLCLAGWYADAGVGINALAEQLVECVEASRKQDNGNSTQAASAVAAINHALLLYVQQQHAKALQILEPLFCSVETIHGGAAVCLCVLLLEVYLGSNQHVKAAQVLHYLQGSLAPEVHLRTAVEEDPADAVAVNDCQEKQHASPRPRNQHLAAVQQCPQHLRSPQQPQQQLEPLLSLQQQQHQQEEESLLPVSTNMPLVSRLTSSSMQQVCRAVAAHGGVLLGVDVPAVLQLYKARLAMACSNFKAAKKEVRSLLALCPDSPAGVLLKCELEVLKQQPKKALKTLTPLLSAPLTCTKRAKLQLLNLLAVIHQQLGKHHVAALYLTTALEQQQRINHMQQFGSQDGVQQIWQQLQHRQEQQDHKQHRQQQILAGQAAPDMPMRRQQYTYSGFFAAVEDKSRQWLAPDESGALQYNLGLQQLLLESWQPALECFEAASSSYYNSCTLWLRLAESSIGLYYQQQHQAQQRSAPPVREQHQHWLPGQPGDSAAAATAGLTTNNNNNSDGAIDSLDLLQQAAQQLSTGLTLLHEQQAEAAKQAEAAAEAAAMTAAVAGEQLVSIEQGLRADISSHWSASELHGSSEKPTGLGDLDGYNTSFPATASAGSSNPAPALADPAGVLGASGTVDTCLIPSDLFSVQQALLANAAYVQLLLKNPSEALAAAQALLACTSSSPHYHHLGSCYAAEALLSLGRPDEAIEQLQGQMASAALNSDSSRNTGAVVSVTRHPDLAGRSQSGVDSQGYSWSQSRPVEHASNSSAADVSASVGESFSQPASDGRAQSIWSVQSQAALLTNLSSVMAAQGDAEGSMRCASAAVAADPGITCSPDVLLLKVQGGASSPAGPAAELMVGWPLSALGIEVKCSAV